MIVEGLEPLLQPIVWGQIVFSLVLLGVPVRLALRSERRRRREQVLDPQDKNRKEGYLADIRDGLWCSIHELVQGADPTPDYFDADLFLGNPKNIQRTVEWFLGEFEQLRLSGRIDGLVFLERGDGPVGAISLKDLLSLETNVPSVILRPKRRGPAFRIKFLHEVLAAKPEDYHGEDRVLTLLAKTGKVARFVLVSDVVTTGTNIRRGVEMIEAAGGRVDAVFVLYDREEAESQNEDWLKQHDIRVIAMSKRSQLFEAIEKEEFLKSEAEKKGIKPDAFCGKQPTPSVSDSSGSIGEGDELSPSS